ncbi:MAG: nucleoside 2-deoxyribosyltransferase domain-containing protein [Schwartzia sp.]|nr:nucleoside 2-deoxyribosyltransferase domain-containing protein [Schwartzia sp. (in: firmicutes)]
MDKKWKMSGAIVLSAGMLLSSVAYANSRNDEQNIAAEEVFKARAMENIGHGKKVYFASPMFNHAEKAFNLEIVKVLEDYGYQVFLPQRDGIEAARLEGKSEEELIKMIFALDAQKVKKADIVFMNIDGRAPDEGACVELGIAYASGKRCYGVKTDTRSVEMKLDMNPMISGCMIKIFQNFDGEKLKEEIRQYLSKNAL